MDRRKTLATVGAISLTASAAVVALGSSMGLFGLTDDSPRVGKLSPIDATQPPRTQTHTVYVDDPVPVPVPTAGNATSGSGTDARSGNSAVTGATDGHQRGGLATTPPAVNTPPVASNVQAGTDEGPQRAASEPKDDASGAPQLPSSGHQDD